jgi:hypothetical protein
VLTAQVATGGSASLFDFRHTPFDRHYANNKVEGHSLR